MRMTPWHWLALVLGFVSLACASAVGQEGKIKVAPETIITFPASWVALLEDAHKRFLETEQSVDCFEVQVHSEPSLIVVSYLPLPDTRVSNEGRVTTTRTKSACGQAMTYEYDPSGKLVRQYINR